MCNRLREEERRKELLIWSVCCVLWGWYWFLLIRYYGHLFCDTIVILSSRDDIHPKLIFKKFILILHTITIAKYVHICFKTYCSRFLYDHYNHKECQLGRRVCFYTCTFCGLFLSKWNRPKKGVHRVQGSKASSQRRASVCRSWCPASRRSKQCWQREWKLQTWPWSRLVGTHDLYLLGSPTHGSTKKMSRPCWSLVA